MRGSIREKVTGRLLSLDRALEPFLAAICGFSTYRRTIRNGSGSTRRNGASRSWTA